MHWHAELTMLFEIKSGPGGWYKVRTYTLRGYAEPGGYDARVPFDAVLRADIFPIEQRAFLSAAKGGDLAPMARKDYRALARFLRAEFGDIKVDMDRHGRDIETTTERWEAGG